MTESKELNRIPFSNDTVKEDNLPRDKWVQEGITVFEPKEEKVDKETDAIEFLEEHLKERILTEAREEIASGYWASMANYRRLEGRTDWQPEDMKKQKLVDLAHFYDFADQILNLKGDNWRLELLTNSQRVLDITGLGEAIDSQVE